jgi:hypothetical protein
MKVLKTLRPGAPGAKRLLDRFGESLVCVRYRHDPSHDVRVTTVELILESTRARRRRSANRSPDPPEPVVGVSVHYRETDLRARIKQAGGRWRPDTRLWELPLGAARRLSLVNRIVRQRATERHGAVISDRADGES